MALGTAMIKALSDNSITAIETVSAISASLSARRRVSPCLNSGIILNEYPKTNARKTEMAILGAADQANAVLIIMPIISPIAHPVRQCKVALAAVLLSEDVI